MSNEKRDHLDGAASPDSAQGQPGEQRPRRKRRKPVIAAIVVAAVVACGAGLWAWHETPGFCAAFCHNMDQYLESYLQEQGVAGHDKYGNEVSDTNALMSVLHRETRATAMPEVRCTGCHHPILGEQVSEGTKWVTGDYADPLDERSGADLTHWWGEPASNFCSNENCHAYLLGNDGMLSRDKLEASTQGRAFNPHERHHGNLSSLECTDCHKGHRASTLLCTGCHEHQDVALPSGWVTYAESQQILAAEFNA